jgi:hypothetical protein
LIPALAAAELQIAENRDAEAKAQHLLADLSARLKSCPDASSSPYGILQVALASVHYAQAWKITRKALPIQSDQLTVVQLALRSERQIQENRIPQALIAHEGR